MRICIDARFMGAEATRGIGRYVGELVRAMLEVAPENRYVLVTRSASHPFAPHPSVETIVADVPWYGFTEQIRLPAVFASAKADLVHVPHWNVPLFLRGPFVVTVHDLLLRHEPASAKVSTRGFFLRTLKRLGYRLVLWNALRRARRILVPTQFVARDVMEFYPFARGKIIVTGEGMPPFPPSSSRMRGPTDYLLYVGSAYPHKGLGDLMEAWEMVSKAHPGLELRIAGEMDAFMEAVRSDAERRKLPRVTFLGTVDDATLRTLYGSALAFVFPSHFEGFGLPPLEALAEGCPVVCSDAASLPEVLGPDGAIFFRAGDPDAILQAIEQVVREPEVFRRNAATAAKRLSVIHDWRNAALHTLIAYQNQ